MEHGRANSPLKMFGQHARKAIATPTLIYVLSNSKLLSTTKRRYYPNSWKNGALITRCTKEYLSLVRKTIEVAHLKIRVLEILSRIRFSDSQPMVKLGT